jgi:NAD(P)-dependent dehydrogenase (short-subunit alcohol dehydrogenase family)
MARILVTGSSDGLGLRVARRLIERGHKVVLHARNDHRAKDATSACPNAETVVTGDLASLSDTKAMADKVNQLGPFDAIIHNAGLYRGPFRKTDDGIPALVAVNTVAPYVLANLIKRPKRLIFLSSGMHYSGNGSLEDIFWTKRGEANWSENSAYCDSKLHNTIFAKAFAKRWPDTVVTALDPGWVATKMGGPSAPQDPEKAVETYVLLAEGEENTAKTSGQYWEPGRKRATPQAVADDERVQGALLELCRKFSGVELA